MNEFKVKILVLLFAISPLSIWAEDKPYQRVVSLNGSITEIVYALGKGDILVGADTTSYYPVEAGKLPKIGYQRAVSLEGIVSLKPDLVMGTEDAGPPPVLNQLMKLGIRVEIHASQPSLESTLARIRFVGENLGAQPQADILINRIQKNVTKIQKNPPWKKKPNVLVIFSRGKGMVNVAGKNTSGAEMVALTGSQNFINEFEGYKPLSPELLLKRSPDVVVITEMSLKALGGEAGFWKLPGFREMDVKKRPKLVSMDDLLLLGFSARLDEAVETLQKKIAE
jgi:iron complex transport system substrate-binding protein